MIVRMVEMNSGGIQDGEDIYQEGWIDLHKKIINGQLDQLKSSLKTYVYRVCKNKWIDVLRKKGRYKERFVDPQEINLADIEEDNSTEESPYMKALKPVLGKLTETCRRILQLFYFEKKSMPEIAELMEFSSKDSAKTQKNKCMTKARAIAKEILKEQSL